MRPSPMTAMAWLTHGLAGLLPVHRDAVRIPNGVPGWEAFRVAFNPVWPYGGGGSETWYWAVLTTTSALTNLLMLVSIWSFHRPSNRARPALAWAAIVAGVVNAQWWLFDQDRADFALGTTSGGRHSSCLRRPCSGGFRKTTIVPS